MRKNIIHLIVVFIFSVGLFFILPNEYFNYEQKATLSVAFCMIYLWITEAIPIPFTSLTPILIAFPLGLIDFYGLYTSYFHNLIFLFLGGFILAKALEKHNLHLEISRTIISLFGSNAKRIVLGFMLATAFLSMWISNTATVLMVLPMALSVLKTIPQNQSKEKYSIALLLSIAFGANVGGTATIVGTPPNSLLIGSLQELFQIEIGFFEWMILGVPFASVMLLVIYFILYLFYLKKIDFEVKIEKPNPLTINQKRVLLLFGLVIVSWMSRTLLEEWFSLKIKDAYIAILGALLLFVIPANKSKINFYHLFWIFLSVGLLFTSTLTPFSNWLSTHSISAIALAVVLSAALVLIPQVKKKALLNSSDIRSISWGILLLFGGGMALASILDSSGLVKMVIDEVSALGAVGLTIIFILLTGFALFATELMSNMALVTVLIPLVGQFALQNDFPLVQLTAAVALAASCAFMLPIATPPNAIVFSSGKLKITDMMRVGVVINCIAIFVIVFMVRFLL
ncbi:MAG: SLC13 family permease [Lishizhenia sp.]